MSLKNIAKIVTGRDKINIKNPKRLVTFGIDISKLKDPLKTIKTINDFIGEIMGCVVVTFPNKEMNEKFKMVKISGTKKQIKEFKKRYEEANHEGKN